VVAPSSSLPHPPAPSLPPQAPTPSLRRSSGSCIDFGTASGLPRLARTVSWCDDSGAPLEHVRTVDRRKKPAGFFAQSFAVLKDELMWSFTRPAVAEANGETAVTEDRALASLEVARQNAVTNVHLVRSLAENLP